MFQHAGVLHRKAESLSDPQDAWPFADFVNVTGRCGLFGVSIVQGSTVGEWEHMERVISSGSDPLRCFPLDLPIHSRTGRFD